MRLFLNGLKRSGNHLVINWLCDNLNLGPVDWVNGRNQHFHFRSEDVAVPEYSDGFVYSFEDLKYEQFCAYVPEGSRMAHRIYVTRSIENLMSSRIEAFLGSDVSPGFVDYRDQIAGDTYTDAMIQLEVELMLDALRELQNYDICIHYDRFILSVEYRAELLEGLADDSRELNDSALGRPTKYGNGSSFLPTGSIEANLDKYLNRAEQLSESRREVVGEIIKRVRRLSAVGG